MLNLQSSVQSTESLTSFVLLRMIFSDSSTVLVFHSALALGINEATSIPRASLSPKASSRRSTARFRRHTCETEEYGGEE
jgi:hypothetical protein